MLRIHTYGVFQLRWWLGCPKWNNLGIMPKFIIAIHFNEMDGIFCSFYFSYFCFFFSCFPNLSLIVSSLSLFKVQRLSNPNPMLTLFSHKKPHSFLATTASLSYTFVTTPYKIEPPTWTQLQLFATHLHLK